MCCPIMGQPYRSELNVKFPPAFSLKFAVDRVWNGYRRHGMVAFEVG